MLHIALIQIITSCALAGSLYGEETKQLFHGGDINTKALDNYMKLFGDNMQFCHKGESNGCMNKQEFNKLIQDKYVVNGEKISPYFDYKVINHNGNSDHGIEEIEVEFSVKQSGCTITRHETQEIHYNKNMVKKVVIKDSKDQKRVCGNNGDQRKLLMNDPVPIKVKPYGDNYGDVTTKSPTKSTKLWATGMPSKAPTAPQAHIVTSTSPTMEPTTTSTITLTPTTSEPTTHNPTTSVPTTVNPTTMHPSTSEPTTANPTTSNPTTSNPTTSNPTTPNPTTSNPTTSNPTTSNPTTSNPTTSNPTTPKPTTPQPTTPNPTSSEPTQDPTTTLQPTGSPLPIPPIATPTPTTKEPTPPQGFEVTTESPTASGLTTSESPKSWEKSSWKKSANSKRNKEGKPARRLLDASNTGYGYYVQTTTKSPTKKVWPTPSPTITPKPSRAPSTPSPITPSPTTPYPTTPCPTTPYPTTPYPTTPSPTTPSPTTPSPTTPSPTTPSPTTPSPTTPSPTTPFPTTPYPTTPYPTTPSPTTGNPTTPAPTAPISLECGDIKSGIYPSRDVWFRFDLSFNEQGVTFSACNSDFNTILELYDSSATQLIAFESDGCGLIIGSTSAGVYNLKLSSDQVDFQGRYQLQIICQNTPSPTTALPTTQPPSFPIPEIVTPSPTLPVNTPRPTFPTLPPNEGIVATPSRAPTPRPVESYGYWEKSNDYWNKNYNYDDEYNGGKWYKYDNYGYDDGRGYKYGKKGGKKGKYGRKWY